MIFNVEAAVEIGSGGVSVTHSIALTPSSEGIMAL